MEYTIVRPITKGDAHYRVLHDILVLKMSTGQSINFNELSKVRTPLTQAQFALICDTSGRTYGYVAWASVNAESFRQFLDCGRLPRHYYEWKEGRLAIVTDLVPFGDVNDMKAHMGEIFARFRLVAFLYQGRLSLYRRRQGRFIRVQRRNFSATEPALPNCILP